MIESRNSEVSIINSDVVTNFYLGYDDIADYYRNGKLREQAISIIDEHGNQQYQSGYGHGYHRYITIASALERYRDVETGITSMPESSALVILESVVQNPYTESTGTSMTQYSAIYNNVQKTVKVWPFQNYDTAYEFDVAGRQIE